MEYIYLMASLPGLELGTSPPLTSADLLHLSKGILRDDHWEDLRAIVEDRPGDARSHEARLCVDLDTQVRNSLLRLRSQRAGLPYADLLRPQTGYDIRVGAAAARAMAADSPIERELILDRHRWTLLDEIAALPAFGVQAVFAYGFKLRLAEKWAAMDDEAGQNVAVEVVERNLAGRLG